MNHSFKFMFILSTESSIISIFETDLLTIGAFGPNIVFPIIVSLNKDVSPYGEHHSYDEIVGHWIFHE